jgi:hypothetical protein
MIPNRALLEGNAPVGFFVRALVEADLQVGMRNAGPACSRQAEARPLHGSEWRAKVCVRRRARRYEMLKVKRGTMYRAPTRVWPFD